MSASAKPSPFFGIELFRMSPAHARRVGALLDDLDRGKLSVEEGIQVILDLVNEFIGSFEDDPEVDRVLRALSGRRLSIQVEGLADVTGTLAPGEKVKVDRGVANGVPALVFKDVPTFEALLTGKLDDVEALRSGRIQVRHLPDFLKMVAPVVALQNKRKSEFRERIQRALDRVLREKGY